MYLGQFALCAAFAQFNIRPRFTFPSPAPYRGMMKCRRIFSICNLRMEGIVAPCPPFFVFCLLVSALSPHYGAFYVTIWHMLLLYKLLPFSVPGDTASFSRACGCILFTPVFRAIPSPAKAAWMRLLLANFLGKIDSNPIITLVSDFQTVRTAGGILSPGLFVAVLVSVLL